MRGKTRAKLMKLLKRLEQERKSRKERIRPAIIKKQQMVKAIKELIRKHRIVAVLKLDGIPTQQYKRIKNELSRYGFIKVYKNSVFLRAAKELGIKGVDELSKHLIGTNAFMFTNLNPYELALMLDKVVALRYAKPGDRATGDIYIPEGPTGIPPGPMLSVFGRLRIRTQVREGVIWVARETKVASAGDEISPELASLLRKLGIKPVEVKLSPRVIWEDGHVYLPEELKVDVEAFKNELIRAVGISREVAIEAAIPIPEVIPEAIARAYMRAAALAGEAGFIAPGTAQHVFRAAINKALALASVISQKAPELGLKVTLVMPERKEVPKEEKKEEEKEEEEEKEVSEEEIAEGISALFG